MSLLSSRMDVRGNVIFDRNTAVFGAGVAMSGRSLVSLAESMTYRLILMIFTASTPHRYYCIMVHMFSFLTMLLASWVQGSMLNMPPLTFSSPFSTLAVSFATTLL